MASVKWFRVRTSFEASPGKLVLLPVLLWRNYFVPRKCGDVASTAYCLVLWHNCLPYKDWIDNKYHLTEQYNAASELCIYTLKTQQKPSQSGVLDRIPTDRSVDPSVQAFQVFLGQFKIEHFSIFNNA